VSGSTIEFLEQLQAAHGGSIPFDRWMQEALYHPQHGYYTANIRDIGRGGDFTTWPVMRRNLSRAIARWARSHQPRGKWHLIEIGAGTGALGAGVWKALGWFGRPQFHIVDVSPVLRAAQRKVLPRGTRWHDSMADALAACDGEAVIYSNELVDAFPCRVFQKQDDRWRELSLSIGGSRWVEHWTEPATLPDSSSLTHPWPDGQRVETQEAFRQWYEAWRPLWKAGAMLVIDYGEEVAELYHRRLRGSLRAYAHHQRIEGPQAYIGFGKRDLTVDVNFTDLRQWLRAPGPAQTLAHFLSAQGQPVELGDAGEAFKVLETAPPAL